MYFKNATTFYELTTFASGRALNFSLMSNSSTTETSYIPDCTWNLEIIEWIKMAFMLIGIIGNGLTFIVIIINKSLHNVTFSTIGLLAFADFLYCFSAILWELFMVAYMETENNFRRYLQCVNDAFYTFLTMFIGKLLSVSYLASTLLVTTLSVFRYIVLVHPLKSKLILNKCIVLIIFVVVWILAVLNVIWKSSSVHDLNSTISNIVDFQLTYTIPLAVVIIFHTLKLLSLKRNQFRNTEKQVKKMEKIVLAIILAFMIFPLPWQILRLLHVISVYDADYIPQTLSGFFLLINNCINPIFYAFLSANVRKRIVLMLVCPCRLICKCENRHCLSIRQHRKSTIYSVSTDTTSSSMTKETFKSVTV